MRTPILILLLLSSLFVPAQNHELEKLWQTDSVVAIPESVLPHLKTNFLYISLIDGGPWERDGKGGIARLKPDGTGYDSTWIVGLHCPKGMGIYKNSLYIADLNEVVVADVTSGKIKKRIAIDSASGLNDLTISDKGVVYVSDSKTAKIWQLVNDVPKLFLNDMKGVNGLKAVKEDLVIASGTAFMKSTRNKKLTKIASLPQAGDGIEPIGNGDYLVSSWSGYLFYVSANGTVESLLESHKEKKNIADIGYDPAKKIVYVPTFFAKTVVAYKLK